MAFIQDFLKQMVFKACAEGDLSVLKCALAKCPEFAALVNEAGHSLLHVAALHNQAEVIRFLVAKGVPIEAKIRRPGCKLTALHVAIGPETKEAAFALITCGADIEAQDEKGCRPIHFAAMEKQPEVLTMLIQRGAIVDALTTNTRESALYKAIFFQSLECVDIICAAMLCRGAASRQLPVVARVGILPETNRELAWIGRRNYLSLVCGCTGAPSLGHIDNYIFNDLVVKEISTYLWESSEDFIGRTIPPTELSRILMNDQMELLSTEFLAPIQREVHVEMSTRSDPVPAKCSNPACPLVENPDIKVKRCGRCRSSFYCSKICQRKHYHEHKVHCQPPLVSECDEQCSGPRSGPTIADSTTSTETASADNESPFVKHFKNEMRNDPDCVSKILGQMSKVCSNK